MAEIKRLTATEREAIMRLSLALEFLTVDAEHIKKRAEMVPNGKAMLEEARDKVREFIDLACDTMPKDQLNSMIRTMKMTTFEVGVKCPATMKNSRRLDQYGVIVSLNAINELFFACGDHCALCIAGEAEAKGCGLRKALDTIPNDAEDRNDGGCPYRAIFCEEAGT